jgi:MFS family permease
VTEIFGSFLAFGVLHMRGVLGWGGWRWLFLIEGSLTLLIGLASFFKMPASAVETKTWFRPKGWFSDREVGILVNRVLRDDPSKGTTPILTISYDNILIEIRRRHAQPPSNNPLPALERTQ